MNFVGMIACTSVALNCAEKAMGLQPQLIFAPDVVWLWSVGAVAFAINAILFAIQGFKAAMESP